MIVIALAQANGPIPFGVLVPADDEGSDAQAFVDLVTAGRVRSSRIFVTVFMIIGHGQRVLGDFQPGLKCFAEL